eukprot:scaffold2808_cov421-Prasinococcus_capsulatus_cf.AAC.10
MEGRRPTYYVGWVAVTALLCFSSDRRHAAAAAAAAAAPSPERVMEDVALRAPSGCAQGHHARTSCARVRARGEEGRSFVAIASAIGPRCPRRARGGAWAVGLAGVVGPMSARARRPPRPAAGERVRGRWLRCVSGRGAARAAPRAAASASCPLSGVKV